MFFYGLESVARVKDILLIGRGGRGGRGRTTLDPPAPAVADGFVRIFAEYDRFHSSATVSLFPLEGAKTLGFVLTLTPKERRISGRGNG